MTSLTKKDSINQIVTYPQNDFFVAVRPINYITIYVFIFGHFTNKRL